MQTHCNAPNIVSVCLISYLSLLAYLDKYPLLFSAFFSDVLPQCLLYFDYMKPFFRREVFASSLHTHHIKLLEFSLSYNIPVN